MQMNLIIAASYIKILKKSTESFTNPFCLLGV
jgi:hypothetical protein